MCLACEQNAMWFAYLRRRGLIDENGMPTEPVPSVGEELGTMATEEEKEASAAQDTAQSADQLKAARDKLTAV